MLTKIRTRVSAWAQVPAFAQVSALVRRSPYSNLVIAVGTIFLAAALVLAGNSKTLEARIDGETVKIRTVHKTVGQALFYSGLSRYQEDLVTPSRNAFIKTGLQVDVVTSIPVQLTVDGETLKARTPARTVGDALTDLSERLGLQLQDVDEVNIPRTEVLAEKMDLEVQRSIPISVLVDGGTIETYMAPRTVADAMEKMEIHLGAKDKISPSLDYMLEPNDTVQVVRVVERVETVQNDIPFQEIVQPGDYPLGLPDRIISRGISGVQEQTVRLTLEDGLEVDRQVLSQRLVTPPTSQVVSRGNQTSVSRGGATVNFKRAYVMRATAYCIPGGITASGAPVSWGVVAVDPRVIPLGTKLYIDGYGEARALDTGGAIKGNRVDLYMNSIDACFTWGVREVIVYVQ